MTAKARPFYSGYCGIRNPPDIHRRCAGAYQGRTCACPHHGQPGPSGGPRIGSLCSGYGGLDTAVLDVFGGSVAWHADNDPAAARVLEHHWPGTPNHGDITAADWAAVEPVDVVTAGYPCQPDSAAGKRRGADDERWIWPAVRDAVRDLGPRLVVLENVRGHLGRGFPTVVGDLADIGYDVRWCCVPASDVGAPHQRERLFAVAHPADSDGPRRAGQPRSTAAAGRSERDDAGRGGLPPAAHATGNGRHERRAEPAGIIGRPDDAVRCDAAADPAGGRRQRAPLPLPAEQPGRGTATARSAAEPRDWGRWTPAIQRWEALTRPAPDATAPGRRGGRALNPAFSEWMMGLPAGWVTAVPGLSRNDQLRLIGNGVVPAQAIAALRWLLDLDARTGAA